MTDYIFDVDNTVVRDKDIYMKFYGRWYCIDMDVSDFKILDNGKKIMYKDCERWTKSLVWDEELDEIRVRTYTNRRFQNEYLLTVETVRDISSYLSGMFRRIKDNIERLDRLEDAKWEPLNSIE